MASHKHLSPFLFLSVCLPPFLSLILSLSNIEFIFVLLTFFWHVSILYILCILYSLCVLVWVCVCMFLFGHFCICVWEPKKNLRCHSSEAVDLDYLRQNFSLAWDFRLGSWPVRSRDLPVSFSQALRIWMTILRFYIFNLVPRKKLRSSCSCSNHFTYWVISLDLPEDSQLFKVSCIPQNPPESHIVQKYSCII